MKRLFFDIETSPNIGFFWRSGYKLMIPPENIIHERAMICLSYKWEGEKEVKTLVWNRKTQSDYQIVKKFTKVLERCDEAVGHNVDKFDMKWFLGKCLIHKLPAPPETKTVDTLVIARRRFALNSNKLDYIAQVLGYGNKSKTNFGMWRDIVLLDCEKSLTKMVKYCERDVKLNEKIYKEMVRFHNPKTHTGVMAGHGRWSCPKCGSEDVSKKKINYTAAGTPRHQMQCKSCFGFYSIANNLHEDYKEAKKKERKRKAK
jgi:hypothetical protein